ncbi:MAG: hypothetical protein ACYC1C_16995 [Chloroflexota bacterium]
MAEFGLASIFAFVAAVVASLVGVALYVVILIALWRMMRAQEEAVEELRQLSRILRERLPGSGEQG